MHVNYVGRESQAPGSGADLCGGRLVAYTIARGWLAPNRLEGDLHVLILTRKVGEALMIGEEVTVTVIAVNGSQVRIGINAPKYWHRASCN